MLNVKCKTLKLLEEDEGKYLSNLKVENDLLHKAQRALNQKIKISNY